MREHHRKHHFGHHHDDAEGAERSGTDAPETDGQSPPRSSGSEHHSHYAEHAPTTVPDIPDEDLPPDLRPDDNPLARGLKEGQAVPDLLVQGKRAVRCEPYVPPAQQEDGARRRRSSQDGSAERHREQDGAGEGEESTGESTGDG